MATKSTDKPSIDLTLAESTRSSRKASQEKPLIDIFTGQVGQRYEITITPKEGRPVLIAVHL
jgi:hypothetical protein